MSTQVQLQRLFFHPQNHWGQNQSSHPTHPGRPPSTCQSSSSPQARQSCFLLPTSSSGQSFHPECLLLLLSSQLLLSWQLPQHHELFLLFHSWLCHKEGLKMNACLCSLLLLVSSSSPSLPPSFPSPVSPSPPAWTHSP